MKSKKRERKRGENTIQCAVVDTILKENNIGTKCGLRPMCSFESHSTWDRSLGGVVVVVVLVMYWGFCCCFLFF